MKAEDFDIMLAAGVRPAAKISTVAEMLEVDHGTVRKMINRGELQAFTLGKRAIRVFLDSVAAYQDGQFIKSQPEVREERRRRRLANSAAHKAAVAGLQAAGILPLSGESRNDLYARRRAIDAKSRSKPK